jgi:DNA-binding XRE family transcriptional regulator
MYQEMEIGTRLFQRDLAKRIGVNEMTMVNWEKGRTKPIKQY